MTKETRRSFLLRYAALALAATGPWRTGAANAAADSEGPSDLSDTPAKAVYGPPPRPPALPTDPGTMRALYGPPPTPRNSPKPAPVYGPPPRPLPSILNPNAN